MRQLGLLFVVFLLDCASLDPLAESTCGNGVVDATEDCDSFPDACGKAGDGVRACRLTCDRTKVASCPDGWGCSVDGICRQATGTFASAGAPTSAGVVTLLAADFDGDGRSDLVGSGPKGSTSKPRVHFFDSAAAPAAPITLPVPMSSPVIADFDRDGRADLAFAFATSTLGGIGVLTGTTDRAFSQKLFPLSTKPETDVRFVAIPHDDASGLALPPTILTLERDAKGTFFRSVSALQVVGIDNLEMPATMGPEQVVGEMRQGRVFRAEKLTPYSACGDVVIPYNEGDVGHVAVLSPCALVTLGGDPRFEWAKARPLRDLVVPKITGNTVVADVNGDGGDEIIVATTDGLFIAFSDGETLSPFIDARNSAGGESPATLAIGDLDGDGLVDIVAETGAYFTATQAVPDGDGGPGTSTGPEIGAQASVQPQTGLWSDARIGRFNADAFADIVTLAPGALELGVYAGTGEKRFTRFAVSSDQPIRAMTTGDFDGDGIQDIAFLSSPKELAEGSDDTEVLVAYGKANGGPEPPKVIARFPRARGLTTLHDAGVSVDDLFVLESTPNQGGLPTAAMTFVFGSGDRQTIAPLLFRDEAASTPTPPNQGRTWLPLAVAAAPFTSADNTDVFAIAYGLTVNLNERSDSSQLFATPFPTGTWFGKANPNAVGGLDAPRETFRFGRDAVRALDDSRFREGRLQTLLVSTAGDIDSPPNGIAEIVALAKTPDRDTTDLFVVRPSDAAPSPPPPITLSDLVIDGNDDLALLDIDGDDLLDAVVLSHGQNRLRVYRNDGKSSFATAGLAVDLPTDQEPVAFAQVLTGAKKKVLTVVTRDHLYFAELAADKTKLDVKDMTSLLGTPLSGRITAIAAGDWDGDGVQDLAIADSGAVRLILQQPRLR